MTAIPSQIQTSEDLKKQSEIQIALSENKPWFFNVLSVKNRYTGYNFPGTTSTEYTIFPVLPF